MSEEVKKYHNINDEVKIDFELFVTMADLVEKAEQADAIDEYGWHMNLANAINSQGKSEARCHVITES